MRRWLANVLFWIAMVFASPAAGQEAGQTYDPEGKVQPAAIWNSRQIDFVSQVTGRPYRLLVSLPEAPAPPAGYPVVYVIDGGLYFGTATETARLQGLNFFSPPIIVAIGYQQEGTVPALTQRTIDLTLPLDESMIAALPPLLRGNLKPEGTGGLDGYLNMLHTEVKARVAAEWPVDPSRQIIFGHSLGGLAVLRQLMREPAAYSGYVASAPSIWFKNRAVLADEAGLPDRLRQLSSAPTVVLLVGGDEGDLPRVAPGNPELPPQFKGFGDAQLEQMRRDLQSAAMVANVRELGERLSRTENLGVTTVVLPDEDHASVVPAAISRGLRLTLTR